MARNALGLEFGSAAQLSKRPGSVWNCLWGNALKRSPGIIRKSRVSYPVPGFLSSATWPSLPKKHYNGLDQTKQDRQSAYRVLDSIQKYTHYKDFSAPNYFSRTILSLLIVILTHLCETRHAWHFTVWNLAYKITILSTKMFMNLCNGKYDLITKKENQRTCKHPNGKKYTSSRISRPWKSSDEFQSTSKHFKDLCEPWHYINTAPWSKLVLTLNQVLAYSQLWRQNLFTKKSQLKVPKQYNTPWIMRYLKFPGTNEFTESSNISSLHLDFFLSLQEHFPSLLMMLLFRHSLVQTT